MNYDYLNWNDYVKMIEENCVSQFHQSLANDLYFTQFKSVFKDTKLGTGTMMNFQVREGVHFHYTKIRLDRPVRVENHYSEDCVALYFCLGGRIKIIDDRSERDVLSKGSFTFYKTQKGLDYLDIIPTDEPYEIIGIQFSLQAFVAILGERINNLPAFIHEAIHKPGNHFRIESLAPEVFLKLKSQQYEVKEDLSHQLFMESKVYELTAYAIAQFTNSKMDAFLTEEEEQIIVSVCEELKENISQPFDLDKIAQRYKLSATAIRNLFRLKFGLTPAGFLKAYRLQSAKKILESGEQDVNGAAYAVGYNSVSSFSRAFTKKFGARPGNFIPKDYTKT